MRLEFCGLRCRCHTSRLRAALESSMSSPVPLASVVVPSSLTTEPKGLTYQRPRARVVRYSLPPVAEECVLATYHQSPQKCTIAYLPRPYTIALPCPLSSVRGETLGWFDFREQQQNRNAYGFCNASPRSEDDSHRCPFVCGVERIADVTPESSQPIKSPKQFLTSVLLAGMTCQPSSLYASTASFTTGVTTTSSCITSIGPVLDLSFVEGCSMHRRLQSVLRRSPSKSKIVSSS